MFEAVGHGGTVKKLSPWRWVSSAGIAVAIGLMLYLTGQVVSAMPNKVDKKEEEVVVDTFKTNKPPPPPPPPPPGPPPKQTSKPMKNRIVKNVVKQEIKPPDPTPIPEKKPDDKPEEKKEEPQEEDSSVADSGGYGVPGGVPGGVIGGVIGGVVGNAPTEEQNIETVDVSSVEFLNMGEVAKVAKANFPEMIKRANIPVAEATVEVICGPDGAVDDVVWISGNELVRDAVMAAVRKARFAPRPIGFRVQIPFRFKLT